MTTSAEHEADLVEEQDLASGDEDSDEGQEQAHEQHRDEVDADAADVSSGKAGLDDDEALEQLRELVSFIAESLVDEPDEVRVSGATEDGQLRLELTVSPDDVGKVIGREGRTARAMRTLLATSGAKMRRRVNLQILE